MKKIISIVLFLSIIISQAPITQADSISSNDSQIYSILSVHYTWRYKFENGKQYKRKYDATHQKYVGDWILVS
ncbi:hypothetical protein [Enterococcus columbae]|uniref:GW domain-containing protein n=1 Tax=Enterococcus columbae DSM 7374 = ATCC 51263 TaxID=1121865 RepID=S1N4G6_9ENTE|nr:hypothetical protein [Enterococcus columbae]EOT41956.1 hypothetical protein OMW_01070 [Enterococcus columbae DSM 7374 = ATCC 51263]EOW80513.1 hypothetical protein I568_01690 [Enterococcus columbae DSM 7374 = ATCC 51263]